MTPSAPDQLGYAILCVGTAGAAALADDLRRVVGGRVRIQVVADNSEAIEALGQLRSRGVRVPAVLALPETKLADLAAALERAAAPKGCELPRIVAIGDDRPSEGAPRAALPSAPTEEQLRSVLREILTDQVLRHTPLAAESFADLLDPRMLARAVSHAEQSRRLMREKLDDLRDVFVASTELTDRSAEEAVIEGIDRALDHPPRIRVPAGQVLFLEDQPVVGIWIVVEGRVHLTRRFNGHEVVFHSRTVGRILGLLALTQRRHAFFSCRALTEVVALYVTWEQLDRILQQEPLLTVHFMTVLVKSLTIRIKKIVDLQFEVERLNRAVAQERDQLGDALGELRATQAKLIDTEKMATLGQLVAGIAHELNNPMTAIQRAVDYIAQDAMALVGEQPDGEALAGYLVDTVESAPVPTAELRRRRDKLASDLNDAALARRLVRMGVTDAQAYARLFPASMRPADRERAMVRTMRMHELGTGIRNLRSSSQRVTSIVRSLRGYARQPEEGFAPADLHEGLEDTLLLFGHRLHHVRIKREYGKIPSVECSAGKLNQVWTNLVGNALDAMKDAGELRILTDQPDETHVRVRIVDSGPGVPQEHRHRIFDLNFTTKHGGAAFGLGMGLLICRQIVQAHSGTIALERETGKTVATVVLPISQPRTG